MGIIGHKERALMRRGLYVQEALKRRDLIIEETFTKSILNRKCDIQLDYIKFGPYMKIVYINGVADTPQERDSIFQKIRGNLNCNITLHNKITNEYFSLKPSDIFLTQTDNKHLYIWRETYTEKIFPNLMKIDQYESYVKSKNIKTATQRAFNSNWRLEDSTHVAGVVGVLPIKDDPIGWSIVNFFNTKESIHDMLKLYMVRDIKEGKLIPNGVNDEEYIINWMSELFKDVNGDDMRKLVEIQEKSIVKNYAIEKKDSEYIRNVLHPGRNIEISGYGTKKDIIQGIDVTIDGITYQIKPLSSVKDNGNTISVSIGFSNSVVYKNKPVQRQAFVKNNQLYVFNNNAKSVSGKTYEFDKSDMIYPKTV